MLDRKKEQHTKNNRSRKNSKKEGKALYKLMKTTVYEKTMENLRNRTNVKLVSNKKRLFEMEIHPNQAICHTKYMRFSRGT